MKPYEEQFQRGLKKELNLRNKLDTTQSKFHQETDTQVKRKLAEEIKADYVEYEAVLKGLNKMIDRYDIKDVGGFLDD